MHKDQTDRSSTPANFGGDAVDLISQINKQTPKTYRKETGRPRRSTRHSVIWRHLVKWTGCRRILHVEKKKRKKKLVLKKIKLLL